MQILSETDFHNRKLGWQVYQCPHCRGLSLAKGYVVQLPNTNQVQVEPGDWYPQAPLVQEYPDSVPQGIRNVAAEAWGCFSVGFYQSSFAMARATIEATAKKSGITAGNLLSKIDELLSRGLIYPHIRDAAHEVRHAGNDAAHGDLADDPIEQEDCASVLELMDMVLDGVFIAPAKTAAQRAAREAKRAVTAPSTATTT